MTTGRQLDSRKNELSNSTSLFEQQWPLSNHRRLRHLYGITIRNLTLTDESSRTRGQTTDDEAIPSTLNSPTKLSNPKFASRLGHASSSLNLKGVGRAEATSGDAAYHTKTPQRLLQGQLKRRITSEWSGASPPERQRKLEEVTSIRMLDTFFSLHVATVEEPLYISEVAEQTTNPDFRFFDLNSHPAPITRKEYLALKVWTKTERYDEYQYTIEEKLNLSSLRYIGKELKTYRSALPNNCVFYHFPEGLYTSHPDVQAKIIAGLERCTTQYKVGHCLPSSTYDSLMRLSALDECIQDALKTRDQLTDDINRIYARYCDSFNKTNQRPEAYEAVRLAKDAVTIQRRRLQKIVKKRNDSKTQIEMRRSFIQEGRKTQEVQKSKLDSARQLFLNRKIELKRLHESIYGQRRRVCFDLANIYPIDPISGTSFAFTIRGLALPKASFDSFSSSHNDNTIAAALGHVAQVVSLLSLYLMSLLPYPISLMGSTSSIVDAMAMTAGTRTYPLFPRSGPHFRFEYGIFLLAKDIEVLTARLDAKVLDIRHILANLKFVLYLATAGEGELPVRKAGGVKGLLLSKPLGAGVVSGPGYSRSTSPMSSYHQQVRHPRQATDASNNDSSSDASSDQNINLLPRNSDRVTRANGNVREGKFLSSGASKESGASVILKETIRARTNAVYNKNKG